MRVRLRSKWLSANELAKFRATRRMDDMIGRQFSQMLFAVADYRKGLLSLHSLVGRLEALGQIIAGPTWNEKLFPLVLELELINSELIDKARDATEKEEEALNNIIENLASIIQSQVSG